MGNSFTVAPDESALAVESWANAVETVTFVDLALIAVLLENVQRTLAGPSVADFRQVALVGGFATQVAFGAQLHNFKLIINYN